MQILEIREGENYITLGQALKKANLAESGAYAKEIIQEGFVEVNGEVETRRGRKLYEGDVFSYDGEQVKIQK